MSDSPKPLHVKVAEALGGGPYFDSPEHNLGWLFTKTGTGGQLVVNAPERYDEDWAATGPLIEKYGIVLAYPNGLYWQAWKDSEEPAPCAETPLLAICELILALAEIGGLKVLDSEAVPGAPSRT